MDILRTLLLVAFLWLVWNLRIGRSRPVRDYFNWGRQYVFLFALIAILLGVVWGFLGASYGAQAVFFDDNPIVQCLAGFMVLILFLRINLQYIILDESSRRWRISVQNACDMMTLLSDSLGQHFHLPACLRNGFLEHLTSRDLHALRTCLAAAQSPPPYAVRLVHLDRFRLLFSPAVLLLNAAILVPLLGVVPTFLVPLLQGTGAEEILNRLPWFLGTLLGAFVGLNLACWSALRLDAAWPSQRTASFRSRHHPLESAAQSPSPPLPTSRRALIAALHALEPAHAATQTAAQAAPVLERASGLRRLLLAFLIAFFLIHFLGMRLSPQIAALGSLDPLPFELEKITQPVVVLGVEIGLAAALLAIWALAIRPWFRPVFDAALGRIGHGVRSLFSLVKLAPHATHGPARPPRPRWLIPALLSIVVLVALGSMISVLPRGAETLARGISATFFAGLFIAFVSSSFSIATSPVLRRAWKNVHSHRFRFVGLTVLALLLVVYRYVLRPHIRASLTPDTLESLTALALGVVVLLLSAGIIAWLIRAGRPLLAYPLTAIGGFVAFALLYDGLPESLKAGLPAAISAVCLLGLIGSLYTLLKVFCGDKAVITTLACLGLLILLDGNAWFRTPNQFKKSFPGLDGYYGNPAVLLNSEAYFRAMMPSVVKLHNAQTTRELTRGLGRVTTRRLASADFDLADATVGPEGLDLTIGDPDRRLRTRENDPIRIIKTDIFLDIVDRQAHPASIEARLPHHSLLFHSFHDATVQFFRTDVPVGPLCKLQPEPPDAPEGPIFPIIDREATGNSGTPGEIAPVGRWRIDPDARQLVLTDLRPEAGIPDPIDQLALSVRWSGIVLPRGSWPVNPEGTLLGFRIRLPLPGQAAQLDDEVRDDLKRQLLNSYLTHYRQWTAVAPENPFVPASLPSLRPGDCLILEDVAPESPVHKGIFLFSDQPPPAPLDADFWLTPARIADAQSHTNTHTPRLQLRIVYDRGIFALDPPPGATSATQSDTAITASFYNGDRILRGDRLVLRWRSAGASILDRGGTFTVQEIGPAPGAGAGAGEGAALNAFRARLVPEPGSDVLAAADPAWLIAGTWQLMGPLDNYDVLQAWEQHVGGTWKADARAAGVAPEQAESLKPPLVIVTVSGGGIRSSVWTATVLRRLEQALGSRFPTHIRILTGASGGMVGGSYYATTFDPETGREDPRRGVSLDEVVDRMARNQLDSVLGQMVFADLPSILNPFPHHEDRGRILEEAWKRLGPGPDGSQSPFDRGIADYAADELLGRRPSLVYTPMMVEDGRRLLISNLDLSFVARNLGGMILENGSRKINHLAYLDDKSDRAILLKDDLFSLSAVEFFRVFPGAWDFRISTATRMSASFPWVSPTVSLPTSPPRRIVDAGYYDNYGVNLAAMWLTELREWIMNHTSGVLIVQIRDHASQNPRTNLDFDRDTGQGGETAGGSVDDLTWQAIRRVLAPGLQSIITPLQGVSAARQWTMSFRNDEQVELLDEIFQGVNAQFFRTVVFECPVEASLSWKLGTQETHMITNGFGADRADIKDYFGVDAAEKNRWDDANRPLPDYQRRLKQLWDDELKKLGFNRTGHLSVHDSEQLYRNVMGNRKRLAILREWWNAKRQPMGNLQ
jgi:hypothetical protein